MSKTRYPESVLLGGSGSGAHQPSSTRAVLVPISRSSLAGIYSVVLIALSRDRREWTRSLKHSYFPVDEAIRAPFVMRTKVQWLGNELKEDLGYLADHANKTSRSIRAFGRFKTRSSGRSKIMIVNRSCQRRWSLRDETGKAHVDPKSGELRKDEKSADVAVGFEGCDSAITSPSVSRVDEWTSGRVDRRSPLWQSVGVVLQCAVARTKEALSAAPTKIGHCTCIYISTLPHRFSPLHLHTTPPATTSQGRIAEPASLQGRDPLVPQLPAPSFATNPNPLSLAHVL
ncbi:hypothetical protein E6O75_ATG05288 [Venturia nashicola]|uniref:Uncharacterized protein n=1 Tax=Venturia nashicola TaxID=86259 RepID=A0A4Z1PFZ2_9PEZI|nr:hypothetical protein E6O75_ATG05288 [Venturia nashicola]